MLTIRRTKILTVLAILFLMVQSVYGQWLSGYSYRKKIIIDHTQVVGGPHTDFPVLVSIAGNDDLKTIANGGFVSSTAGNDFRFTDDDALTLLDFDIEKYDGTNGDLVVWVKIPSLSNVADKEIYLYFGNPSASAYPHPEDTWSNGYVGVYHLHDNFTDVSSNGNNGTNHGTVDVSGQVADAQEWQTNTDYIRIRTNNWNVSVGTIQLWARTNGVANDGYHDYLFGHTTQPAYQNRLQLYLSDQNNGLSVGIGGSHTAATNFYTLSTGVWYFVTLTWDGTNFYAYVNGTLQTNNSYTGLSAISSQADIGNVGNPGSRTEGWNGDLDEARVSTVVRSPDWIATEYQNQSSPSTFITVRSTNDLPCEAIELPVDKTCSFSMFSNNDATDSGEPDPGCNWSSGDRDVWFHLIAPSSGKLVIDAGAGTLADGSMAAYSGSCNSLVYIDCNDDYHGSGGMPYLYLSGLTPGEDIFVRFWGWGLGQGTFYLCAYDPVPTIYNVTGSGKYCAGGSGLTVQLSGSDVGTVYQLLKNGADDGPVVNGTGGPLSWTNKTEGVYHILAVKLESGDSALMNGKAIIIENPLPVVTFGYGYEKTITIDANRVAGSQDLVDFPVLISFTDPDLKSTANGGHVQSSNGYDVAFTDSAFNPISFELENYDPATGQYTAWVNVPLLSHNTDTKIHMLYGKSGITSDPSSKDAWGPGFVQVLHLDDDFLDATKYGNPGFNDGTSGVNGKIGRGRSFDGVDNMIIVQEDTSLEGTSDKGTFSLWINWDNSSNDTSYQRIMTTSTREGTPNDGYEWASQPHGNHFFYPKCDDAWNNYNLGPDPFTDGQWQYLVVTLNFDTKSVKIYVDGTPMTFTTENVPTYWTSLAHLGYWRWGGEPGYFAGMMDEIHVQNVERSGDWIMTEYRNQNDPSSFYSVSPESEYNPLPDVCLDDLPLLLDQAKPAGGVYSGAGVSGGYFYPRVAGSGIHTVTYTYTDSNGCTGWGVDTITVHDLPTPAIAGNSHVCPNA